MERTTSTCLPRRRPLTTCLVFAIGLFGAIGCGRNESEIDKRPEGASLAFTDVTSEAGLSDFRHVTGAFGKKWFPEAMGSGGGFVDFDGDGWQDILLVGGGSWPESGSKVEKVLRLYRNDRDGTFSEATNELGLPDISAYGIGVAAADYDNDDDQDIFLTTLTENLLFRNDGKAFTEVGRQAGVAGEATWSSSAIFFDADRDGDVDLYVGHYVEWSPETDIFCSLDGSTKSYCTPETYEGTPSSFYRNDGDGTFTDATVEAGFLPAPGKTLGASELDYNRDGWPDLIVANDTERDLLYVNDGDGTFTERGALSGVAFDENGKARAGMGVDAGVVDTTGEVSIFVGNFSKEMIGVYRHMDGGLFTDRAAISQIGRPSLRTLTFGLFLFDADLDTDLDLFAANGHVQPEIETTQEGIGYAEAPHLFLNDGSGTFRDVVSEASGALSKEIVARGAAYADYDRDGDLDVLITTNAGPAYLWRNDVRTPGDESPAFLRLRLEGSDSNRDGISSRIIAVVDGVRMERRIRTGSSYLSQSELAATFGLGDRITMDTLIVEWISGRIDRFADLEANREYGLREGSRLNLIWE